MAESTDDLKREYDEFEQAGSSLDSGLESAPSRNGIPGWILWVVVADLVIIGAVVLIVFAS